MTGITPINIFVKRASRGQGYAKRLLNAFCARPGTVYCYSCVKSNLASYRTALSCGFRKVGEYLLIV
jgi:RimJ/RimL family protein N-acetyltransferase